MPSSTSSQKQTSRKSVRTSVTLAIVAGGSYLAVMVLLWVVLRSEAAEASEWVAFLGRFHFLILHLPIGFLTVALFLEVAGWFMKPLRAAGAAITPVLWLTFFGGVGATICGFLLSKTGGYSEELLNNHMRGGITLVGVTLLTLVAKIIFDRDRAKMIGLAYRALLFLSGGLLAFSAHHGGSLTHGEGFLTKHTPPLLKKLQGIEDPVVSPNQPKKLGEMEVYHDLIVPVMEAKCWLCHNESKIKGELRMDTFALLLAGGESGRESIIPGNPDESELFYRMVTDDEDEIMPPEGKDPMTPSEIQIVKWWIQNGAKEHVTVADLNPDSEMIPHLEKLLISPARKASEKKVAEES